MTGTDGAGALRQMAFAIEAGAPGAEATYLALMDGVLDTRFLGPFAMHGALYRAGRLVIVDMTASARVTSRLAERIAIDPVDAVHVQYVADGMADGTAGAGTGAVAVDSRPGTVMLLDFAQPFAITDRGARTVLDVTVPRHLFSSAAVDPSALHGRVLDGGAAAPLIAAMAALHDMLALLPAAGGAAVERALLGLIALAIGDAGAEETDGQLGPAMLLRAERWVDFKIGSPDLGPAWLAEKLDLSRTELYGAMRPFGGAARFIAARRLRAAREALCDAADRRPIGEISRATGFKSEAHFSRSFKMAFGIAPSAFRTLQSASPSRTESGERTSISTTSQTFSHHASK